MMTEKEMLNYVVANVEDAEVVEKATAMLAAIAKRNEKRASTPSKTAIANEPLKASIVELLEDGGKFASEVAKSLEVSTQKASGLLVQLEKAGQVEATEVKVPKKGKAKFYTLKVETNAEYLDREVRA